MTDLQQISIPKPCHQSWQQMTGSDNGRHCQHCCKTVVDFTTMTDDRIISWLSDHRSICGRFEHGQLNKLNYHFYVENRRASGWWKRLVIVIGIFWQEQSFKAVAQNKPVMVQHPPDMVDGNNAQVKSFALGKIYMPRADSLLIQGRILDDDDNVPIPGVRIKIPMTNYSTSTDQSGRFSLTVPIGSTQFLVSLIGYVPKYVVVEPQKTDLYIVNLKEQHAFLGEVVIKKSPFFRRIYWGW